MDLKFTSSIATPSVNTGTLQRGDSQKSSARNTGRRPDSSMSTIPLGEVMTEQPRQDALVQPLPRGAVPVQDLTNASATEWRPQKWHKEQEREWEGRLSDLRQCICELLVKNQQLRELLTSATCHQSKEST